MTKRCLYAISVNGKRWLDDLYPHREEAEKEAEVIRDFYRKSDNLENVKIEVKEYARYKNKKYKIVWR